MKKMKNKGGNIFHEWQITRKANSIWNRKEREREREKKKKKNPIILVAFVRYILSSCSDERLPYCNNISWLLIKKKINLVQMKMKVRNPHHPCGGVGWGSDILPCSSLVAKEGSKRPQKHIYIYI
ncbi:hypothetical protein Dimus_007976 [Dionaea muscipula]